MSVLDSDIFLPGKVHRHDVAHRKKAGGWKDGGSAQGQSACCCRRRHELQSKSVKFPRRQGRECDEADGRKNATCVTRTVPEPPKSRNRRLRCRVAASGCRTGIWDVTPENTPERLQSPRRLLYYAQYMRERPEGMLLPLCRPSSGAAVTV